MKISKFFLLAAVALMGAACTEPEPVEPIVPGGDDSGNGDGGGNEPVTEYTELELKTSADYLTADGVDQITFTVIGDGKDITEHATIYDNKTMQEIEGAVFSTTTPGTYTFWAAVGTQYTEKVKVTALENAIPKIPADPQPENTVFAHRTLVIQFTGTGCGNCPSMSEAIKNVANNAAYADKFYLAKHHSYNQDDPMFLNYTLADAFGVQGYPYVVVGFEWGVLNTAAREAELKASIDECMKAPTRAGLAVNSQLAGNTLTVSAELKAAETGDYSIGCWVLEDGISAYQAGAGYITHDDAIRIDNDPVIGNSVGSVEKGKTANTLFNFNLKNDWVKENCHLILFVCHYDKEQKTYYINNAIAADLNESKTYEYQ